MDDQANQTSTATDDPLALVDPVAEPPAPTDAPDGSSTIPLSDAATDPMKGSGEFNYLQNIQTQINLNIAKIERLKEEMQPVKEMIESYLENDPNYMELVKKAKEASSAKSSRKKELMSTPNGKSMDEKMNKLKEEQKEANDMISQLLGEYRQTTGANEFEGPDGELRTIVMVAKLVRKTNLNRD